MHRQSAVACLLGALAFALAACGGSEDKPAPGPSGATCLAGSTLRYAGGGNGTTEPASFGSTFFATYCTACHGAVPSGGAPPHASLDTQAGIQEHRALIDEKAAAGPSRTNTGMPVGSGPVPSAAERSRLGAWLACGAP